MRRILVFASGMLLLTSISCASKPSDEAAAGKVAKGSGSSSADVATDKSGPPRGVIDAIEGNPIIGSTLSLRGWAAAPMDGAPVKKIEVVLDGRVVGSAATGFPRQDVVSTFHRPDWLKSGWTAEVYLNNIKPGMHRVDVIVYDSRNMKTILPGSKTMTVVGGDQKSS